MVWGFFILPESRLAQILTRIDHFVLWFFLVEYLLRVISFRPPGMELFNRTRGDRFRYSLQSLGFTLLLSLPGPLVCGVIGVKLKFSVDHNVSSVELVDALGTGATPCG